MEACYRMKPLILLTAMTVIGLFGIIGTVEYAEAKTYTHNIFGDCKNEIIHLHENDILQIHNNDPRITPNKTYYWNQYKIQHNGVGNVEFQPMQTVTIRITPNDTYTINGLEAHEYLILFQECNDLTESRSSKIIKIHKNNPESTTKIESKLDKQKDKLNDKIEQKNKWKERYNTCFDKKENFKTELSDLESRFNILQTNMTNTNFEIDKLKQEKANLIKQVETLETQLQEN